MPTSLPPPDGPEGIVPADPAALRLPVPDLIFRARADRLHALAPGHVTAEFLAALAHLADAQIVACRDVAGVVRASPVVTGTNAGAGAAPPRLDALLPAGAWRAALDTIVRRMRQVALPAPAAAALDRLARETPSALDSMAAGVLGLVAGGRDASGGTAGDPSSRAGRVEPHWLAAAPFVAAALQVCWTTLASQVPPDSTERSRGACPLCGSPPVAGVIHGDQALRYLTCGLCAAEWHLTRLTCAQCGSPADLSYWSIESPAGLQAEACARCRTYVKLFSLEQMPDAEPFVDDLATLALDVLMAEEGYARAGVHPWLLG